MASDRESAASRLSLARRSLERQSLLVAVLAAVLDVAIFSSSGIFGANPGSATAMALALVAADLALSLHPRTTAAVAYVQVIVRIGVCVLLDSHAMAAGIGDVGVLIAGYRSGAWLPARSAAVVVPVLTLGTAAAAYVNGSADTWWLTGAIGVANAVIPYLVGRYTAAGGAYITKLELQRDSDRAALEKALADEREAIARDLHDVISHHVSAIGIHAGVARMTARTDLDAAGRALAAIESSSRAAMLDLRRQLDILHGRDSAGERQPGLANISVLTESVGQAGLAVTLDLPPEPIELPQSLDVTVYRIIQELLTNALRHSDGTFVLRIRRDGSRIVIEGTNPIAAHEYTGGSLHRGLEGMRRRAELFDGHVESGPDGSGSWHTVVTIPIGG